MDNKRKRASNFTLEEERLILSLVEKYSDVIECKKTDAITNATKAAAWRKLAEEYNFLYPGQFRDLTIIKKKYENLKKNAKKKYVLGKTKCEYGFVNGMGDEQVTGASDDDDYAYDPLPVATEYNSSKTIEENESLQLRIDDNDIASSVDNAECHNSMDYTSSGPNSSSLQIDKNHHKTNSKLATRMSSYLARKESERKCKMKYFLEEHALKMKYKEKLFEQQLRHKEEIHNLQKELLRKQISKNE